MRRLAQEVWVLPSLEIFKVQEEVSNISELKTGTNTPVAKSIFICFLTFLLKLENIYSLFSQSQTRVLSVARMAQAVSDFVWLFCLP